MLFAIILLCVAGLVAYFAKSSGKFNQLHDDFKAAAPGMLSNFKDIFLAWRDKVCR